MKQLLIIFNILILTSCDFKPLTDYYTQATELEKEGKYAEAIQLLDKVIEKDSSNIYALIDRGVDKSILEDYKGSIVDYTRVIELDSDNTLAFQNRGKNKKRLEDYQGAIKDFEKAIHTKGSEIFCMDKTENSFVDTGFEFDVKMEEIRFERGLAYYEIDSLDFSINDMNFCIQNKFMMKESFFFVGVSYFKKRDLIKACSQFKIAASMGEKRAIGMSEKLCHNL